MTYTREQVVKLLWIVESMQLPTLAAVAIYLQEDMDVLTQDDLNDLGYLLDAQLETFNNEEEVIKWVLAEKITDPIHHYYGDDPLPF